MFETLALIGGFWFFVFALLVFGVGIVSSEFDSFVGGVATLILLVSGLYFFGAFSFESIFSAPLALLSGIILYIVIGFAYALLYRYPDHLNKNKDIIQEMWQNFQKSAGGDAKREDFYNDIRYRRFLPSQNVERITAWITLWPWSAFWDLSHKPIRWVYRNLYSLAGKMLDNISKRIFNNILDKSDSK